MFLKEAIKTMKTTGAIASSSRFLINKMIAPIDFDSAKIIIEFGAGLGGLTKVLLQEMKPETRLISYEINGKFCEKLSEIKDKRFTLVQDDVRNLGNFLKENNIEEVDYIISGLPLAIFKKTMVNEIMEISNNALKEDGKYIQFQYSTKSRPILKKHFKKVKLNFTSINIPPAFIYTCFKS